MVATGSKTRLRCGPAFGLALAGGILTAVITIPAPAGAADASFPTGDRLESPSEFSSLTVISKSELAEMRGGLILGGLQMEFGANVRTIIDDLALETVIKFADSGPVVQQVTSSVGVSSDLPGSSLIFGDGSGAALQNALPSNVDLSGLAGANGVILNDAKGFTAALHQVNQERITSVLVNMANERNIRQQIDVTVNVPNFRQFQQAVGGALLSSRIADAINR